MSCQNFVVAMPTLRLLGWTTRQWEPFGGNSNRLRKFRSRIPESQLTDVNVHPLSLVR